MNFESAPSVKKEEETKNNASKLSEGFRGLVSSDNYENDNTIFEALEEDLNKAGFNLATEVDVSGILNDNALFCRSESFTKVIDLIVEHKSIDLLDEGDPNMCTMNSGDGFRTAMMEGFSGKDVNAAVKVVLTFKTTHLFTQNRVPKDHELWNLKPDMASVSLIGKGSISLDDVEMVSFRFPTRFYPEHLLTENEKERLEESGISFVVRHYIPDKQKTVH